RARSPHAHAHQRAHLGHGRRACGVLGRRRNLPRLAGFRGPEGDPACGNPARSAQSTQPTWRHTALTADDDELLTRAGPGTAMGELLRRYWTPACLTAEVPEPGGAPARVRLLGENLVAYRDTRGRVGLVQENCPHRGASLYFGRNEDAAIRCVYHGWAFD